ncbi:MAG TPA: Sec-dependent nitrous-oxide reductase, partial [Balneolales bacterium]|nr:Sec-dependent nitrous-oxide reductase [Balneolales bacterium]
MSLKTSMKNKMICGVALLSVSLLLNNCTTKKELIGSEEAANQVYVPPGKHDEFYSFMSGGWTGNVGVYGIPSGRHIYTIPVFSVFPTNGYGYTEESKAMLNTSHGFIPWGDAHHTELSETDGVHDGRWLFINENNTPRIARIDLKTFRTMEIIEIPNSAGNHASSFSTQNTEYVTAATRFSIPLGEKKDIPIKSYNIDNIKDYNANFGGTISFIKVDPKTGRMNVAFQILVPGFDYDLGHAGKGPSKDWAFFTCYNSEQANTLLEINASKKDKDFVAAINWKKAEQYAADGKGKVMDTRYAHNYYDPETDIAQTDMQDKVVVLDPRELSDMVYYLPTPKSPHGVDVDPTGEYIVAGGKLSTILPVHSFSKMTEAIQNKEYDGEINGIPILKYESVIAGEVKNPGLGPLHTEFDANGFAYTTAFISSEIVKWQLGTWKVIDRHAAYYSPGHLSVPGGDTRKPWGKYVIALNKLTKDRYLPTGPEMYASAQLFDISGDKMKLILDFPTEGEPHYAQEIPANLVDKNQLKIYKLEENKNPYAVHKESETKVVRNGKRIDVYLSAIRSHFVPDNIEGI